MNRQQFLKKAGLGSAALAAFPVVADVALAADGGTGFHFISLGKASTVGGVFHRLLMGGDGKITPSNVVGNGMFVHFDGNPALPTPKPILGTGNWKAKRLIDFDLAGTFGAQGAGIVEMEVVLVPEGEPKVDAILEVVCNSGGGGIFTGEEEGFVLTIPGTIFVPGGTAGPFVPTGTGVSTFSVVNESRD